MEGHLLTVEFVRLAKIVHTQQMITPPRVGDIVFVPGNTVLGEKVTAMQWYLDPDKTTVRIALG